jgi:hypothetical protein
LRYIHLALILIAVYIPDYAPWALPTLAAVQVVFALMFYWLCFTLLSGLSISNVNSEIEVADAWSSRFIQFGATALLYSTGDPLYQFIAIASAPWIVINIMTDAFATLIKWEILEVTDKEE